MTAVTLPIVTHPSQHPSLLDGRGEEDVHNGDDSERSPLPAPAARTDTLHPGSWPWPTPAAPEACPGGEDGRTQAASLDVAVAGAGSAAAGTGPGIFACLL